MIEIKSITAPNGTINLDLVVDGQPKPTITHEGKIGGLFDKISSVTGVRAEVRDCKPHGEGREVIVSYNGKVLQGFGTGVTVEECYAQGYISALNQAMELNLQ